MDPAFYDLVNGWSMVCWLEAEAVLQQAWDPFGAAVELLHLPAVAQEPTYGFGPCLPARNTMFKAVSKSAHQPG